MLGGLIGGLLGCGPTTGPPSDTNGSTTMPTGTASSTTTPPSDTTTDPVPTPPVDSGDVDSGGAWLDFPEECSPYEQSCPPGYKCAPFANDGSTWNDARCVPVVDDPRAPGEPCTVLGGPYSGEDDCDGTSMCWDVDEQTGQGTCRAFCVGDASDRTCAATCETCQVTASGATDLCFPICDPILQTCPPGEACYPNVDGFLCVPDASPRGTGIGSPCEFINVCPPGMVCVESARVPGCDPAQAGCCTAYCPVDGADPCPGLLPGSACVASGWYLEANPDITCLSVLPGACVTPP